jgi:hypothetical protein
MPKVLYCWRCRQEIPMLDEREWEEIYPLLKSSIEDVKNYRSRHPEVDLLEARRRIWGTGVLQRYFELTGFRETNINAIWHHRANDFGPPCQSCGKPLRTPKARFCAECPA